MEDAFVPVPEPRGDLTPPPVPPPTAVGAATPGPEPEPRPLAITHRESVRIAEIPVEIVRAVDRVLDVLDQVGDFIAGRAA